jgi:hypothetical protein
MYNVLEKLKAIEAAQKIASPPSPPSQGGREPASASTEAVPPLSEQEERIKEQGLILILKELHERLDALVFRAYGWPQTLTDEEVLSRLVALNHERAEEEKRGLVRWLRPDYQIPRFAKPVDTQAAKEEGAQTVADLAVDVAAQKPAFPSGAVEQTAAVFAALAASSASLDAGTLATQFRGAGSQRDGSKLCWRRSLGLAMSRPATAKRSPYGAWRSGQLLRTGRERVGCAPRPSPGRFASLASTLSRKGRGKWSQPHAYRAYRHCEPNGSAQERGQMTGSAKQSRLF